MRNARGRAATGGLRHGRLVMAIIEGLGRSRKLVFGEQSTKAIRAIHLRESRRAESDSV